MRPRVTFVIGFLVSALTIGESVIPVSAKEIFKDEAGRTLYIIDDDGMVSMFENSSGDITLSVKRGLREKMYPTLDEITPSRVAAGASTTLKLRGQNLVGAKISLGVPQIEVGAYLGHPQIVEVPILIPASVAPGDVAITVSTPLGSAVGSFKVTGEPAQADMNSPSRNKTGKLPISTEAPPLARRAWWELPQSEVDSASKWITPLAGICERQNGPVQWAGSACVMQASGIKPVTRPKTTDSR